MSEIHEATPVTQPIPHFERLLDSREAAALLQIHPKTLQRLARKGEIRAMRIGKLWRFRASDLDLCRPTSAWVGNEMRGQGEDKRVSPCRGFLGVDRKHIMKRDSPIVCGEREETATQEQSDMSRRPEYQNLLCHP